MVLEIYSRLSLAEGRFVTRALELEELVEHFTLVSSELELLRGKAGATRLASPLASVRTARSASARQDFTLARPVRSLAAAMTSGP